MKLERQDTSFFENAPNIRSTVAAPTRAVLDFQYYRRGTVNVVLRLLQLVHYRANELGHIQTYPYSPE